MKINPVPYIHIKSIFIIQNLYIHIKVCVKHKLITCNLLKKKQKCGIRPNSNP